MIEEQTDRLSREEPRLERLSAAEIEGPNLTSREESLAVLAARVSDVLDSRRALRAEWERHLRQHGPERDPFVRAGVEQAMGRRLA